MRIVFLGTPDAAVPSLEAFLTDPQTEVAAVVTNPDRPSGRGHKLTPPPVKVAAEAAGVPVWQPQRPREVLEDLRKLKPDACAVVAYGALLPQDVLDAGGRGFVNLHFSLLPAWRGAAPVQHSVHAGDTRTGVTCFVLEAGMDTGPVLQTAETGIGDDETAGELITRLAILGAPVLVRAVQGLVDGSIEPVPQDHDAATYAPKITPEDARIVWDASTLLIKQTIRAFNPMPGAWTQLRGERLKVHRAQVAPPEATEGADGQPGLVLDATAEGPLVRTADGAIVLSEVQPAGKPRMAGADFVNGYRPVGEILGVTADEDAGGLATRRLAYHVVRRVHEESAWSGPVIDGALRRSSLEPRDRAFATNLAYETLRWEGTLDWALSTVVTRPLDSVEPDVLDVLRLGAWQVLYGGTPDRAAVDTAVEVARSEIGQRVTGFVNGVLRGLSRGQQRLPWPPADSDRGLGLQTGYADWIVAAARARFGAAAAAVLEAGNAPPGLTLRAVGDRAALIDELASAGVSAEAGEHAPEAVRVGGGVDPNVLSCVAQGRAVIQDEASMVVARAAAAGRETTAWRALDVAAAPGGKSTHLAQLGGIVVANDLNPGRVRQMSATVRRLGMESRVSVLVSDGRRLPLRAGTFDVVVLDAPCSGLGVVRRRPELRWRRDDSDVRRLAALQVELLESAAQCVAEGGTLLYSVCTWTAEETTGVVSAFLLMNGDRFVADPLDVPTAAVEQRDDPGAQLAPHEHGTDGMYLCRFRRESRS